MDIQKISSISKLKSIEGEWRELCKHTVEPEPYLTFEYMYTWMLLVEKYREPFVLLVREEGKLIGVIPLFTKTSKKYGISLKIITFPAKGSTPPNDFLVLPSKAKAVVREVLKYIQSGCSWDICMLDDIPDNSPIIDNLMTESKELGIKPILKDGHKRYFIKISGEYEEYILSLSKKVRKNLKSYKNRCNDNVKFVHITSQSGDVESGIEWIKNILQRSWKKIENSEEDLMIFLIDYIRNVNKVGRLSIWLLFYGDKPISYILETITGRQINTFHCAYDLEFQHLSPGTLVINEGIRYAHDNKFLVYSFDGHNEYLKKWSSSTKTYKNIVLLPPNPLARLKGYIYLKLKEVVTKRAKIKTTGKKNLYKLSHKHKK